MLSRQGNAPSRSEAVGNFTVFNIKGNTYRLIVSIDYEDGTIYYKYFLTHAEYDKDKKCRVGNAHRLFLI